MDSIVKLLLTVGIGAAVFGVLFIAPARTGRGRLPGDLTIRPGDFVFYSPLGLSIVSFVLTALNLCVRR